MRYKLTQEKVIVPEISTIVDPNNFKGKFFGPDKITSWKEVEEKTYLGNLRLELTFESGKIMVYPLKVIEGVVSEIACDLTELRNKIVNPVVEKILMILAEAELNKDNLNYAIGPKLTSSLDNSFSAALTMLWGKEDYEVTLFDINKILKSKNGQS